MIHTSPVLKLSFIRSNILMLIFLLLAGLAIPNCSSLKTEIEGSERPEDVSPYIHLNINEILYFQFLETDSSWTGAFQLYTLNDQNEKVVQARYVSAEDSSWNDFGLFVESLDLFDIPPQYELEGWVPNSGTMPRRVYNFEVFDGDTTRSFSYQDPERSLRTYWEAQSILTFFTFIQNDLRWFPVNETPDK